MRGHDRRIPRSRAAHNGGSRVSHDRGAVTVGNETPVWPSPTPGSATTTSSVTSRSDQRDHARLRLVTRFLPAHPLPIRAGGREACRTVRRAWFGHRASDASANRLPSLELALGAGDGHPFAGTE